MPADPTERALALLSLLSSQARWTGPELAQRLGVTERTVRRDIDRLRSLDYPVDSVGGTDGGYRLRSGSAIPPLFLDEDETVATVTALIVAIGSQTTGMVEGSTRALGKLHHVVPARLMSKAAAVEATAWAGPATTVPQVEPKFVAALAEACRNRVAVHFGYRTRQDASSERRVEPASMMTVRSVWYLIGFDLDRDDWRLFRIDRMRSVTVTGHGISARDLPGGDPLTFLSRSLASAPYAHTVDIVVDGAPDELQTRMPWLNLARIEQHEAGGDTNGATCTVHLGGDVLVEVVAETMRLVGEVKVRRISGSQEVTERLDATQRRLGTALAR